jgi:hypothetical protein
MNSMRHSTQLLASTAAALSLAAAPLSAADMEVADLRLGVGVLSQEYKGKSSTTISDQGGNLISTSSDDDSPNADRNARVQLQYVAGSLGAGGGLIWGAGVAVNNATWNGDGQDAHVTTPVINVMLGYGYAFTPAWHLELTPFAGYGRGYFSVSNDGSTETSEEWVDYVEYGVKVGTYLALNRSLVLGVEVPYLVGRLDPDYDYTDNGNQQVTVSDERRNQGFGVLLSLGYRL